MNFCVEEAGGHGGHGRALGYLGLDLGEHIGCSGCGQFGSQSLGLSNGIKELP